jgi:hypothetical protein
MKLKQKLAIAAAVIGVCTMGVMGWWVGGMGQAKQETIASAKPTPEVPVAAQAAPAAPDTPVAQTPEVINAQNGPFDPNTPRLIRMTTIGGQQELRIKGGNLVVQTGDGQPAQVAPQGGLRQTPANTTVTRVRPLANNANQAGQAPQTVTITGGNGAPGTTAFATVDANGNITSIRIDNANGQNLTVNGTLQLGNGTRVLQPATPQPAETGKAAPAGLP